MLTLLLQCQYAETLQINHNKRLKPNENAHVACFLSIMRLHIEMFTCIKQPHFFTEQFTLLLANLIFYRIGPYNCVVKKVSQEKKPFLQCSDCGSTRIVYDEGSGEHVCANCGYVIGAAEFNRGPEWKAFTPREKAKRRRVGAPAVFSRYDKGLSTVISLERDASGHPISPEVKRQMWRLRRWQTRSRMHASKSRNLMQAMNELDRLSEKLNIPSSIQETAALIYRKALNRDLVRGRSIAGVVAAALYAACRLTKTPKTLKEIAETSLRGEKEISKDYRIIVRELDIKMPIDEPLDYVSRIADKAGISGETQGLAVRLIHEAQKKTHYFWQRPFRTSSCGSILGLQTKKRENNTGKACSSRKHNWGHYKESKKATRQRSKPGSLIIIANFLFEQRNMHC